MTVTSEETFIRRALEEGADECVSAGGPPWRSIEEINWSRQQHQASLNRAAEPKSAVVEPHRVKIIDCLKSGKKNVSELAKVLKIPTVNVSYHLSVLRSAGLVSDDKRGRFVYYTLRKGTAKTSRVKTS